VTTSRKYALIGAVVGAVSAAANARPLTIADLLVGAVVVGLIGFGIGRWQENRS
jgi:membrane protein DedA with SNARE-associated domain